MLLATGYKRPAKGGEREQARLIRTSAQVSLGFLLGENLWAQHAPPPAGDAAGREDFWNTIRSGHRLKLDYINLENGFT